MTETDVKTGIMNWFKGLPWYWKILGSIALLAVAALAILQAIRGSIDTTKPPTADAAHGEVVDNQEKALKSQQEALRERRKDIEARIKENDRKAGAIGVSVHKRQQELKEANTDDKLDAFQKRYGL